MKCIPPFAVLETHPTGRAHPQVNAWARRLACALGAIVCSFVMPARVLPAQTPASIVTYGAPCPPGSNAIGYSGMPRLGGILSIESAFVNGVPNTGSYSEWLLLGIGRAHVPIVSPGLASGHGCAILVAVDVSIDGGWAAAGWRIPIPNRSSLLGFDFYAQRLALWGWWGPHLYLSEGLRCTIGN
jgi:hypothetical protein